MFLYLIKSKFYLLNTLMEHQVIPLLLNVINSSNFIKLYSKINNEPKVERLRSRFHLSIHWPAKIIVTREI